VAETPLCDDNTTTHPAANPNAGPSPLLCPVCWTPFTKIGRQRYCTQACRKTAWTRRNATPVEAVEPVVPQGIRRRDVTIYECPTCETRYHGEQWCHDCNQPCTRVGLGGSCPHCSEPVAISDLIDTLTTSNIR
jgi:predicted amidophosphoribosyltransferase